MPKKAIYFGATIVLTLAIVVVLFTVNNKGTSGVNNAMSQYDDMMSPYDDMRYSIYDDSSASGREIIDLIKDIKDDGVSIVVINGSGKEKTYTYASVTATSSTDIKNIKDKSKTDSYIKPTASFSSQITRDVNDIITKVTFTQIK